MSNASPIFQIFCIVICMLVGIYFAFLVNRQDEKDAFNRGYQQAVRDIMRYCIYFDSDGNMHEVDNVRPWND